MGAVLSSVTTTKPSDSSEPNSPTPSDSHQPNSPSSPSPPTMSSLDAHNPESKPPVDSSSIGESTIQQESEQSEKPSDEIRVEDQGNDGEGEEEEEEEGECGFCLFMKGGGCRDAFVEWENCIKEAENNNEDLVEKCFEVTGALRKCMEAHADYYEPLLRAEKAAEEEAKKELEKEAGKTAAETEAVIVVDLKNSESKVASNGRRD